MGRIHRRRDQLWRHIGHPWRIILADDDGVTVVPLARAESVLSDAQKKVQFEADVIEKLTKGEDTNSLFPMPDVEHMR